jgi:cephalosporin hydroxylase
VRLLEVTGHLASRGRDAYKRHGLTGLIGSGISYVTRPLALPMAIRSLRQSTARVTGIDDAIRFVFNFKVGGITIAPMQVHSEITALCEALQRLRPATILEIGTARGGSLYLFARMATPAANLVSVDLPFGKFGGGYPTWRKYLYQAFAGPSQSLTLLRADSHTAETIETVRTLCKGRPVDFLFVDGDHSYEGVKADFDAYSPLVRPGGLIGFHDIVSGVDSDTGGVPSFWQDLKRSGRVRGQFREVVQSWDQRGFGIGLISLD